MSADKMRKLGQIMPHLRLVLRMGQTTGIDLAAAHREGILGHDDWAEMVQSCRKCEWATGCPEWLNRNDLASQAPQTCPNRERLAALKSKKSKAN